LGQELNASQRVCCSMKQKTSDPAVDVSPAVNTARHKSWSLELPALLAGLVLGAVGGLYWAANADQQQAGAHDQALQAELLASRAELAQAHAQLDALTGRLVMEESTRKGLESNLQAVHTELGQARDQLAFFDQLFPPGPQGAV